MDQETPQQPDNDESGRTVVPARHTAVWNLFGIAMDRHSVLAGVLFSMIAFMQLYAGAFIDALPFPAWLRIIASEVLLIGLPPVLLSLAGRLDLRATFRLRPLRPASTGVILFITPMATIAAICAGILALFAIRRAFGSVDLGTGLSDLMDNGLPAALVAVAVSPAICEELMFRGSIMKGLESLGAGWMIFFTGLLFGLFHFDFQRLAAQTLLGWVIAYAVYRTGSILAGMLIHFLHNGFSVSIAALQPDSALTALIGASGLSGEAVPGGDVFSTPAFEQLARQYGLTIDELLDRVIGGTAIAFAFCIVSLFGLMILLHYVTRRDMARLQGSGAASRMPAGDFAQPDIAAAVPTAVQMDLLSMNRSGERPGSPLGLIFGAPGLALILWVYTAIGFNLAGSETGRLMMRLLGV